MLKCSFFKETIFFKLPQYHIYLTPFNSQDVISNSPYCLPYNLYDGILENLELDQTIIPQLIFFFILITYLFDIVEIV